jgi:chorismate mutase/prephenate dehydratase
MSACLALEETLKVAFLGPEGTFTQAAALKHFGHSVTTVPIGSINDVFREVESGSAHYGVVPIENSTEGVINHTLDMFINTSLNICGEVELRIHHHLLGKADALGKVKKIYSHQQSLAQCREWLDTNLPDAERIAVSSNAEAARCAAEDNKSVAIAGDAAASIYNLNIIHSNIEDEPDNTTRFLVIGRHKVASSGNDKTTILMSAENKVGTLYRLLSPFMNNNISMTRIESRPSRRGMWDYVFFVDIEGHVDDADIAKALDELKEVTSLFKILGSYPRAVL